MRDYAPKIRLVEGPVQLDWTELGACVGADIDLWFPPERTTQHSAVREAKKICATCQVREDCLEYAIEAREEWGVWGGTTRGERRQIIASRARGVA